MTEAQTLLVILALLYLAECLVWAPRSAALLRIWGRGLGRLTFGVSQLGNSRGSLALAPPLPMLGHVLIGTQPALSISPEMLVAFVPFTLHPAGRPAQTAHSLSWEAIQYTAVSSRTLLVNDRPILRAATPQTAVRLMRQIDAIRQSAPAQRAALLERSIEQSLDLSAARRRWQEFGGALQPLRWLASALFVFLFGLAPLAGWQWGLTRAWLPLLAGLLALSLATAWRFRRLHREWYPDAGDDRFTRFLMVLLSPVAAMRAADFLARPVLESYHPLVLARLGCSDADFRAFARRVLLDMRHPARPAAPSSDRAEAAAVQLASQQWLRAVEAFLQKQRIDPDDLARPPDPIENSCRSYCPRCEAQFTFAAGSCPDCGGLPTRSFSGGGTDPVPPP
ncbi:MAG: hypothetical protein KA118_03355 [Verrucomicrobia bacterium]|nr:hypothetical protein [Verrucomicrobiota bacterium]